MSSQTTAMLAYLLGPLSAIPAYFYAKDDPFVRFHAVNAFLFSVAAAMFYYLSLLAIVLALMFVSFGVENNSSLAGAAVGSFFIAPLVIFGFWVFAMYKAFNGQKLLFPIISEIASSRSAPDDTGFEASLAYAFGFISGVAVFVSSGGNAFSRFHGLQSVLLNAVISAAMVAAYLALFVGSMAGFSSAAALAIMLLLGASVFLDYFMMYRAITGGYAKLPVIGAMAEKYSAKKR